VDAFRRISSTLSVRLSKIVNSVLGKISEWSSVKNLTMLDLGETDVSDVSPLKGIPTLKIEH